MLKYSHTFNPLSADFVCVGALHSSQQLNSHVGTISSLPGLTSIKQGIKSVCLILYAPVNNF